MGVSKDVIDSFKRGKHELENAENFMEIDLPTAASRLYIAGENLAFCLLLAVHKSSTRDRGKIWNDVRQLYQRGVVNSDFRPVLETSYRLRIKADYGRDIDGIVTISRDALKLQIASLKKFLEEVKRVLKEKNFQVE